MNASAALLWLVLAAPVRVHAPAGPCPLGAQLQSSVEVEVVADGWLFEALLEHEGAEWRVLLRKPDGTAALRRTLTGGSQCWEVTFAAQLIIERFVRELDLKVAVPEPVVPTPPVPLEKPKPVKPRPSTPLGELAPPAPAPAPAPVPAPTPAPPPPPAPRPELPKIEESGLLAGIDFPRPVGPRGRGVRLSRWEVAASGAAWLALEDPPAVAFEADAAFFISDKVRLSAQFAFTGQRTVDVLDDKGNGVRGTLTTQPFLFLATGGYCLPSAVRTCASVVAGAHAEQGSATGENIFASKNLWLVRPAFGAELQFAVLPIQQFVVALSGTLLVLPVPGVWTITGLPSTESVPLFEALLRLSLGVGGNR